MKFHPKSILILAVAGASVFLLPGCAEHTSTPQVPSNLDSSGVASNGTVKLDGEIVSVPSPTLLAMILQKSEVAFNKDAINPLSNRQNYVSEQRKALNLGVYGADLSYIANFEKGQENSDYMDVIAQLAGELNILDHIDKSLVSRINNNVNNRDSLIALNASFFHAADKYLKSGERGDLAGLILVGGWVEALHLAVEPAKTNAEIRNTMGDQKYSAKSILNLLNRCNDPSLESLKSGMSALVETFTSLESSYKYHKPITDSKKRITYFTSKTSVQVSDEELAKINEQLAAVRAIITQ